MKSYGDRIDTILANAFGVGPKYKPKPPKLHTCSKCKKKAATYKEVHPDTSINDVALVCGECGFRDE